MTASRLKLAPCPTAAVARLQAQLGVSDAVAQVLVRRGLSDPDAARAWLAADERHDPSLFAGMDEAVALVRRHLAAGSRITVHGDYDVDGVCSTAILVRALRALAGLAPATEAGGARIDWFLPSRLEDGYGLSAATVDRLARRGTQLLVTADCAITAVDEVAAARAAGIDVLVTDHHSPRADGVLPDAPIVHPALCGYPCAELCAAGVAAKLAEALGAPTVADDSDLVALATVADVVALRGENRRLVREGVRALARTRKPGLRALMRVARVEPSRLDAQAVGFRLAPRINAAGRIARADAGLELVLTEDDARAGAIAEELDRCNAERRHVEQRMLFEAEAQAREQEGAGAIVVAAEGWHAGVAGIVASRLAERMHRPAVVIALDGGGDDGGGGDDDGGGEGDGDREGGDGGARGTGSARSIPAFDLLGGLTACAEHLERHGGHRAAAGLEIRADAVDAFRAAFRAHAEATLTEEDLVAMTHVDAIVSGGDLGLELAEELDRLAPFGHGNPAVSLLLPAARLSDPRPMGEGRHLRFSVEAGGARSRAVAFATTSLPVGPGEPADAVVRLELDDWGGAVEPRLVLRCAQAPDPGAIELLGADLGSQEAVLDELDAPLRLPGSEDALPLAAVDRTGRGAAGTVAALVASGERVLVVAADARRRLPGMTGHVGGFSLCDWSSLDADPSLAAAFEHVVALDPPPAARALDFATVLAWGDAEERFAREVHAAAHPDREVVAAVYRALGAGNGSADVPGAGRAAAALRGAGSSRAAGRALRVLAELALVVIDRDARTIEVPAAERTELERSAAFRAYRRQREDGFRYLDRRTRAQTAAA